MGLVIFLLYYDVEIPLIGIVESEASVSLLVDLMIFFKELLISNLSESYRWDYINSYGYGAYVLSMK